jgi:integrase
VPRLTKRVIDAARPKATRFDLWDDALPGFGVRVFPSGTKSFFLYYRDANRRANRLTLGQYGAPLTVDEARQLARTKLLQAKAGDDDPAEKRRRQRTAPTIAELAKLYRAERIPRMKASTQRSEEDLLRAHVLPRFGTRSILAIDKRQLEALRLELARGAFNKVLGILSRMYGFAAEIRACERGTNPAHGVKKNPERKLERFLTADERARLEAALVRAEKTPMLRMSPAACGVFRLLAATGMRLGEVLDLRWRDVDTAHRRLVLPTHKAGVTKYVALSSYAIAIIDARPEGEPDALVFATDSGARLANMQRRWQSIRAAAGLRDVRIHDLRHAWASDAVMQGVPLHVVGRQLGHKSVATTNRYAHLAGDVFADAVERVGAAIEAGKAAVATAEAAKSVKPERPNARGAKVIPLAARRRRK